jgi:hypothetical protein
VLGNLEVDYKPFQSGTVTIAANAFAIASKAGANGLNADSLDFVLTESYADAQLGVPGERFAGAAIHHDDDAEIPVRCLAGRLPNRIVGKHAGQRMVSTARSAARSQSRRW